MRVALVALVCVGCAHPAPVPVVEPHTARPLTRVTFAVDVKDAVELCVQTTAYMHFSDPNLPALICLETVGDLRDRAVRTRAAQ